MFDINNEMNVEINLLKISIGDSTDMKAQVIPLDKARKHGFQGFEDIYRLDVAIVPGSELTEFTTVSSDDCLVCNPDGDTLDASSLVFWHEVPFELDVNAHDIRKYAFRLFLKKEVPVKGIKVTFGIKGGFFKNPKQTIIVP